MQLDDFEKSPIWEELLPLVGGEANVGRAAQGKCAKGLFNFTPVEAEFAWRSSETHTVKDRVLQ